MPRLRCVLAMLGLALAASACSSTGPDQPGVWGSEHASLTITSGAATLQILASGGCYGSFGEITQPLPAGSFEVPGVFVQLTGVAPGRIEYAAEFSGVVSGRSMMLTVTVPTLGPAQVFNLTRGVDRSWPACLYP